MRTAISILVALVIVSIGMALFQRASRPQTPQIAKSNQASDSQSAVAPERLVTDAIDALKNRNSMPLRFYGKPPVADFPEDYDWDEQARVIEAIATLNSHIDVGFREMASHINDDEYCATCAIAASGFRNWTRGEICSQILLMHIPPVRFGADVAVPPEPWGEKEGALKDWLIQRREKTLADIQIEALSASRAFFERADGNDVSNEARTAAIAEIERAISAINADGGAIRGTSALGDLFEFEKPSVPTTRAHEQR